MASTAATFIASLMVVASDVQRAAEDEREAQDVVDLVGIVRTAGGDDGVGARGLGDFRQDFRIGIGQRQDQRLVGHQRQPFGLEHIGRGKAQEHVGADQHIAQGAGVGLAGRSAPCWAASRRRGPCAPRP